VLKSQKNKTKLKYIQKKVKKYNKHIFDKTNYPPEKKIYANLRAFKKKIKQQYVLKSQKNKTKLKYIQKKVKKYNKHIFDKTNYPPEKKIYANLRAFKKKIKDKKMNQTAKRISPQRKTAKKNPKIISQKIKAKIFIQEK
ncbi:hypothetical protein HX017_13910, partial [Myroides marinus]|uniref:hypothetical protein n=2 Tax=Myroides marinus TaxID=703342 RepID=UPI0025777317